MNNMILFTYPNSNLITRDQTIYPHKYSHNKLKDVYTYDEILGENTKRSQKYNLEAR